MAESKSSARIVGLLLIAVGFAVSCAELLGDIEVFDPDEGIGTIRPDDGGPPPPRIICEEPQLRCDGELLQTCVQGGTAWLTLQACATAALCESGSGGGASGCVEPTCALDQMSCQGNALRLCNSDRNGWDPFDTCETAGHCDAGARQCLFAPCQPGDRRCNTGSLERCQDDQLDWELLDTCETNELCDSTLEDARSVLLMEAPVQGDPADPDYMAGATLDVSECLAPTCLSGELRCVGDRLDVCDEGRTGWREVEICATPTMCVASLTYVGLGGRPRCQKPACEAGKHECTPNGVLQRCTEGRDAFLPIESCIGPPFCNAVEADAGRAGCLNAPCEAGEQRCNGPQPERCLADRTGFEPLAARCATSGLCNAQNAANRFCNRPACERGPTSTSEFLCQGASLLRCNDQHTGYEPFQQCVTPGLCNAGFGFEGCRPEQCSPGQFACNGDTLARCNDNRTGFQSVEACGPGECNAAGGRCADPCIEGTARCNADGTLEECRNRLVGREVTARCASQQLCNATTRTCAPPVCSNDGFRRCRAQGGNNVLEVCVDGRSRFQTLDTCGPTEFCDVSNDRCDVCDQSSQPTCQGNNLLTCAANGQSQSSVTCGQGCATVAAGPDRCRTCVPGSASCDGTQFVLCETVGNGEIFDREACDSGALCQLTLGDCRSGGSCSCRGRTCDENDFQCNGRQPQECRDDFTAYQDRGPACRDATFCVPTNGTCLACGPGDLQCAGTRLQGCRTDRLGFENLQSDIQCVSRSGPEISCDGNGTAVDREDCEDDICLPGIGCAECDPAAGEVSCLNDTTQRLCISGDLSFRDCATSAVCRDPVCIGAGNCSTVSTARGTGCDLDGPGPGTGGGKCDGAATPSCVRCLAAADCNDGNPCTADSCVANACVNTVTPPACDGNTLVRCAPSGNQVQRSDCGAGLCDVRGCRDCTTPGNRRCFGVNVLECSPDRLESVVDTCGAGFTCTPAGNTASCRCTVGELRCGAGTLERCNDGTAFVPVAGNAVCNGATRISCNGNTRTTATCASAALCQASSGGTCIECLVPGDCANPNFCDGVEQCNLANNRCADGPDPCLTGVNDVCDEAGDRCVECLANTDCGGDQVCVGNQCLARQCTVASCDSGTGDIRQCNNGRFGNVTLDCAFGCSGTTCSCSNAVNCPNPNNACAARQSCSGTGTNACVPGETPPAGTECGTDLVCASGQCVAEQCTGTAAACDAATGDVRQCVNGRFGNPTLDCAFGCSGTTCSCNNATNCPDASATDCVNTSCSGGGTSCVNNPVAQGTACAGGTCNANGACVAQCTANVCNAQGNVVACTNGNLGAVTTCQFGCQGGNCQCNAGNCDSDPDDCSVGSCAGNNACATPVVLVNGEACGGAGSPGSCNPGGQCVPQPANDTEAGSGN